MFFKAQHIHFVGIGGIGMSGIAELLLGMGYRVSGSDLKLSAVTARLAGLGARVFEGHRAEQVAGADAVVISSAVSPQNGEVIEARLRNIPVVPRGEMLAELMRRKYGVAVAGSHGKTTTTSMIASVMSQAGLNPTVAVGGRVETMGSNARLGEGQFMVVESDESDRSFLRLAPIVAVITTIDREHLDCYGTLEEIERAYADFANKVPFYGAVVVALDEPNIRAILPRIDRRVITYGFGPSAQSRQKAHGAPGRAPAWMLPADLIAADISSAGFQSQFRLCFRGRDLGRFSLPVPGRHNVLNAMAAAAVGLHLDVAPEAIRNGLAGYGGVDRRFQVRGRASNVTVVDDYGHHPTEIRATLAAARDCGFRRTLVVFQPHRYTRTQLLLDEFARCFSDADYLWVLDIYPASEPPIEGVHAELLVEAIRRYGHPHVRYAESFERAVEEVAGMTQEGDLVMALGAGNVNQICERILAELNH